MPLTRNLSLGFVSAVALLAAAPALAQSTPAPATPAPTPAPIPVQPTTAPAGTVAQALAGQSDHTTFVKLVQAAGLESVLSGPGPVTVFAPDDAAFGRLNPAVVQQLLDPASAASTKQIVNYHIVSGSYTAQELLKQLKAGGGTMTLNTMDNQPLTLTLQGESAIQLTDAKGGKAFISKLSDSASNGVIEYINGVLSPTMMAQPAAPATPGAATPATNTATPATDTGAAGDQGSGDTGA
jgi:uncharacterized surface protein with fasciclin (FAS1) repeats